MTKIRVYRAGSRTSGAQLLPVLGMAACLALAACGGEPAQPAAEPAESAAAPAPEAVAEAPADAAMSAPVAAAPAKPGGDPIRGPGGTEEQCLARVAAETGAVVDGTNRIEESEANTVIYVNVQGAAAPWACYVNSGGEIWSVEFTGSEGAL